MLQIGADEGVAETCLGAYEVQCQESTNLIGVAVAVQTADGQQDIASHTTRLDACRTALSAAAGYAPGQYRSTPRSGDWIGREQGLRSARSRAGLRAAARMVRLPDGAAGREQVDANVTDLVTPVPRGVIERADRARRSGWTLVSAPSRMSLAVGLGAFVLYAIASVARFARMHAGIDLAIYDEAVNQYSQGHLPWSYLKGAWGFDLLGDHFSPVVAVLAPVYRMFPDARVLLVAQAALIGLSVVVLTRTAVSAVGPGAGVAIGVGYSLAWGIQSMALFDFHEVAFALPLLAMSLSALTRGRHAASVAWALPLMIVKEDSVFLLLGIALVLAVRRRWLLATCLASCALLSFWLIVGIVIPAVGFYHRYTYWSVGGIGVAVASLISSISSGKALTLLIFLLVPSLGLAVRSPIALAVIPALLSRFTSPNEIYWGTGLHYNATVTLVIAFAACDSLRRLHGRGRVADRWLVCGAWCCAIGVLGFSWSFPLGALAREETHPCPDCAGKHLALSTITDGVSVAADDTLAAYLVDRTFVHELKPGLRDTTGRPVYPKFIAIDRSLSGIWAHPVVLGDWREQLIGHDPEGPIYHYTGEWVLAVDVGGLNTVQYDVMIFTTPYPTSRQ